MKYYQEQQSTGKWKEEKKMGETIGIRDERSKKERDEKRLQEEEFRNRDEQTRKMKQTEVLYVTYTTHM